MNPRTANSIVTAVLLGLTTLSALGLLWLATLNNRTARECLNLGYAQHRVIWGFSGPERFCIARQDQSDIVRPLTEARQHPRR
jgi:hypothetical protein